MQKLKISFYIEKPGFLHRIYKYKRNEGNMEYKTQHYNILMRIKWVNIPQVTESVWYKIIPNNCSHNCHCYGYMDSTKI